MKAVLRLSLLHLYTTRILTLSSHRAPAPFVEAMPGSDLNFGERSDGGH